MAHCWRTPVQPSALTRSPPTFKRRQAACESLAGRLHSERDNVVSNDATLGVFIIPSPKKTGVLEDTSNGRCPCTSAGMSSPHPEFNIITRRVLRAKPQRSAHFYYKKYGSE